ncbi:MAG: phosphatase PAP2 family protein [Sphingobacteriales bacterium]|nr:phosphatase PAP2 family protein [Sphingobacteriales bacterium]
MKTLFRKFSGYYLISGLIIIALTIISLAFPKPESFLAVNRMQTLTGVAFFKIITLLGNAWIYLIMIVICLFIRFRFSLIFFSAFVLEGLLSQFLKKIVFQDVYRPLKYFELQGIDINIAEGVKLYRHFSFPSGHSATAFTVFSLMAFLILPAKFRWVALLFALLTAFSRVYLGQHFIPDIAAGSFNGLLVASVVYWWFEIYRPSFLESKFWTEKRIRI